MIGKNRNHQLKSILIGDLIMFTLRLIESPHLWNLHVDPKVGDGGTESVRARWSEPPGVATKRHGRGLGCGRGPQVR